MAQHIDQDPEAVRQFFVGFEGKKTLEILYDHNDADPYSNIISDFSSMINTHLGVKADWVVCDFSTTTPTDRLSSQVALMGSMRHYFDYRAVPLCGYPLVSLEGAPSDWESVRDRANLIGGLVGEWSSHLLPILDQFVAASQGIVDLDFWRRAYAKNGYGSDERWAYGGGDPNRIDGWLNVFFPYLRGKLNASLDWERGNGNDLDAFPANMVSAPVKMILTNGDKLNLEFYGGLVGCSYDAEINMIAPTSGWMIRRSE